jgi:hypothetical protein
LPVLTPAQDQLTGRVGRPRVTVGLVVPVPRVGALAGEMAVEEVTGADLAPSVVAPVLQVPPLIALTWKE